MSADALLEVRNLSFAGQCHADLVKTVQQAVATEGVDREAF